MDQLILLPSILLHENNQLVQDDLAALSWPGCASSFTTGSRSSFCGSRVTFTANGTFYVCVKNDGMSDQVNPNQQRAGSVGRPSSAKSNRERQERIVQLKERQDNERIKKLEELKEQAMAASKLREEQDSRRKKHFEDLVKKEDDRRRQAEERRRMLDEERKLALQAKWESKKASPATPRPQGNRPTFAFGSCTPRLVDNHVDGFLWKSQYNLNVTREPGMRASSAQDLHLQPNEVRMSTSMYDWNQQRTTMDNPLAHRSEGSGRRQMKSRTNYDASDGRVFCGRRKTDLTPTVPIRRDVFDMSASMMSRSTSRGSGRVYSSMTRLDRSRSPGGGNLLLSQHQHHQVQRPSRSKSTTHLSSTGLKLTRTEMLRQALVAKKENGGFRSVDQSRPPSSMSSSLMTSSTHSQVQMRPRGLVRKSRPASVHVTGVSQDLVSSTPESSGMKYTSARRRIDTSTERKSSASSVTSSTAPTSSRKLQEQPKRTSGKTSPSPAMAGGETNTIKRPVKRSSSVTKDKPSTPAPSKDTSSRPSSVNRTSKASSEAPKSTSATPEPTPVPQQQPQKPIAPQFETMNIPSSTTNYDPTNPFAAGVEQGRNPFLIESSVDDNPTRNSESNENNLVSTEVVVSEEVINNSKNESKGRLAVGNNEKVIENFESIESAFASGSDDFTYSSKTPEPSAPTPTNENQMNVFGGGDQRVEEKNDLNNPSALVDLLGGDLDFSGVQNANSNVEGGKTPDLLSAAVEPMAKSVSPVPDNSKTQGDSAGGTPGSGADAKPKIMTEEQAKVAIAEKRRLAREAAEREAARLEEEQRLEEERQRLEAEESERIVREARAAEEERLRVAIEEQQKREAEEKLRKEEEERNRAEKERQEREAAREAERIRLEMEERLKREEDERLERRKRVEAIMARTRKKEAEQQAKNNPDTETNSSAEPINGHKENNALEEENNVQSSNNSLNNNYNNNNDFGGNNSTLIEFDGMGGQETGSNLVGDNTGLISNAPTSNPIMNNPLQDLLS